MTQFESNSDQAPADVDVEAVASDEPAPGETDLVSEEEPAEASPPAPPLDPKLLDPATRPSASRATKRRASTAPIFIGVGTLIIFGAAFIYDSARASRQQHREDKKFRSALGIADEITAGYVAGEVPADQRAAEALALQAGQTIALSDDGSGDGTQADSDARGKRIALVPPPPPPPGNQLAAPNSALDAQGSNGRGRDGSRNGRDGRGANGRASARQNAPTADDEALDEFASMRLEMFKRALGTDTSITGDSTPTQGPGGASKAADPASRLAQIQASMAQMQPGAGGYLDKLKILKDSGLLPSAPAAQGAAKKGDAYSQFAGDPASDRWKLGASMQNPGSRFELRAGSFIPATLQTGINSALPGQIVAIVSQDVRDTARGQHVLIPQGSKLIGSYGNNINEGQERLLVAWQRIQWPDGKVLDIGAMPGADGAGSSGFKDQVNTHFWRLFGSALLMSGITAGISIGQGQFGAQGGKQTVTGVMSQSLGTQLGQLTEEMIRRQMNVAPTLEIRPGYRLNVSVTKDLTFSGAYKAFDYERSISDGSHTFRLGGRQ